MLSFGAILRVSARGKSLCLLGPPRSPASAVWSRGFTRTGASLSEVLVGSPAPPTVEEDGPGPSFLYRAEATYIGDGIDIAALRARPEFQGCFSASHRGALLLGPHQSTDPDTAEAEVRAIVDGHWLIFVWGYPLLAGPFMGIFNV